MGRDALILPRILRPVDTGIETELLWPMCTLSSIGTTKCACRPKRGDNIPLVEHAHIHQAVCTKEKKVSRAISAGVHTRVYLTG